MTYSRLVACTRVVTTGTESESILNVQLKGFADDSDVESESTRGQKDPKFFCFCFYFVFVLVWATGIIELPHFEMRKAV